MKSTLLISVSLLSQKISSSHKRCRRLCTFENRIVINSINQRLCDLIIACFYCTAPSLFLSILSNGKALEWVLLYVIQVSREQVVVVMMKAHRRVCDASVSQMSNWGLQLFSWPLKVHKQLHTQLTQNKDRLIKNTLWSWWQVRENVMQQTVKAGRAQKSSHSSKISLKVQFKKKAKKKQLPPLILCQSGLLKRLLPGGNGV